MTVDAEPPRSLHFPTETGGNPWGLACAERRLGARSETMVIRPPALGHAADRSLTRPGEGKAARIVRRLGFGVSAFARYDVFHFNFGQSLLPGYLVRGADMGLLRAMGKRVFMTFMGSDIRTHLRADGEPALADDGSGDPVYSPRGDRAKRLAVARAERWCDRVFCLNPDLCARTSRGEFLPYTSVDPRVIRPRDGERRPGPVRIAHAPTNRRIKGTRAVVEAVERLGESAELILIENLAHGEAMRRCAEADILVDQLRVGWYGGLAVECMARGIPVVAYIRGSDLSHVPRGFARELPIVGADALPGIDVRLLSAWSVTRGESVGSAPRRVRSWSGGTTRSRSRRGCSG